MPHNAPMRLLTGILCIAAARATTETCETLWSKLTRLGCDTSGVSSGVVEDNQLITSERMRCAADRSVCYRADDERSFTA